jgi:hypothetical protein
VPPERLLKAMLLQALYSIRSERQLVERIDTDLLFRWFLDLDPAAEAVDATAFTHNRPRLDAFGLTAAFFGCTVKRALKEGLAKPVDPEPQLRLQLVERRRRYPRQPQPGAEFGRPIQDQAPDGGTVQQACYGSR